MLTVYQFGVIEALLLQEITRGRVDLQSTLVAFRDGVTKYNPAGSAGLTQGPPGDRVHVALGTAGLSVCQADGCYNWTDSRDGLCGGCRDHGAWFLDADGNWRLVGRAT